VRPVSGLEECFIDITHVITCLYEFSITIRNPAPRDRLEKCSSIPVSHFEDFDIQHASHKFPNTAERYLVERLGKANTRRRQLLKYHSKHHDKIAGTYNKLVLNPAQGLEAKKHDVEGQIKGVKAIDFDGHESAPIQVPETIKSATTTTMRSQTTVSTFVQRPDNFDAYSDTDNSQTSYASSSGEDSLYVPRLRVPPPPNQDCAFEGKPFQCPLCYLIISISEQNSWKYACLQTNFFALLEKLTMVSSPGDMSSETFVLMFAHLKTVTSLITYSRVEQNGISTKPRFIALNGSVMPACLEIIDINLARSLRSTCKKRIPIFLYPTSFRQSSTVVKGPNQRPRHVLYVERIIPRIASSATSEDICNNFHFSS